MFNYQLKVCVINPNFYRSSGVTVVIKGLSENALNTDFFFIDCKYNLQNEENNDTSWIHPDRYSFLPLMSKNPLMVIVALFKLLKYINANKIQVVHLHHRRLVILLGWLLKFYKVKVVYTSHLSYKFSLPFYLSYCDVATGVSESSVKNIQRTTRFKKVSLIPNGCKFAPNPVPVDELSLKTVCYIGRLDPVKNHHNLFKAWAKLEPKKYGYVLKIIGEGDLKIELVQLIKELGVEETIILEGFLPNPIEILKKSLFHILPSWLEGYAMVNIEAASVGRASCVSAVPGSIESIPLIATLPNLMDPSNVDDIHSKLRFWLEHPADVIKEGKLFYDYFKGKLNLVEIAHHYEKIYQS